MANVIIVLALIAIAVIAIRSAVKRFNGGCCGGGDTPVEIKPKDANTAHYKYKTTAYIDGMTCAHCKVRVENAFNSLPECCARVDLKKNARTSGQTRRSPTPKSARRSRKTAIPL